MDVVKNILLFRFFIFIFKLQGEEPLYYMEPDFMMMTIIIIMII